MAIAREIFVVGKPRSGTSLIRAVLARSAAVHTSRDLPCCNPPTVRRAFLDLSLNRAPQPRMGAQASSRREATVSDTRTPTTVIADGKALPNIHYLPALIERHPGARFVHVVRDIRGVYLSQTTKWRRKGNKKHQGWFHRLVHRNRWVNGTYSFITVAIVWLRMMQLDDVYRVRYPDHYRRVKYEDFLEDPATVAKQLCDFVGIPYQPSMLDVQFDNSSFAGLSVPRKSGIDAARAQRWRRSNSPAVWLLGMIARKQLSRLGYE